MKNRRELETLTWKLKTLSYNQRKSPISGLTLSSSTTGLLAGKQRCSLYNSSLFTVNDAVEVFPDVLAAVLGTFVECTGLVCSERACPF